MMKKFGIIILVTLFLAVGGLWYLGGTVDTRVNSSKAAVNPSINLTNLDGLNEDEKLVALVSAARAVSGQPLLDPAADDGQTVSAFRLILADLQISTATGPAAARAYGQAVSEIFAAGGGMGDGSELPAALTAFKEQTVSKTESARREAERYGRLAASLQAIGAPDDLKYVHLNLLNALLGLAEIDSYLADILAEPIIALDQAQTFARRYERLAGGVLTLNQVLLQQNLPLVVIIPNAAAL